MSVISATTGTARRLSHFRGRYVLLDFWGSWCGPCIQEIPNLVKAYDRFENQGLVIISISNDIRASQWDRSRLAEYTAVRGMRWIQVLDDADLSIHTSYEIQIWPSLFLISPQGTVVQR